MKGYYATSTKYLERYKKCPELLLPVRFLDTYVECKDKEMAYAKLCQEQNELEEKVHERGESALSRKDWFERMKESGVHSLLELGFFAAKHENVKLMKQWQTLFSDTFMIVYHSLTEARSQAEKKHTPYAAVVIEVDMHAEDDTLREASSQLLAGIGRVWVRKNISLDHVCKMYTNDANLAEICKKWNWSTQIEKLSAVTTPFSIT